MEMVTNISPRDVYGARFAHNILSMAARHPVLLYSMMSAAMLFMRVAQKSERNHMLEIQLNAKAVQLLSEQMRDPATAVSEANIWSVVALGYSAYVGELRRGRCPRQSFLKELQSLHVYGRLVVNKAHLAGLMQLVQMLGGVDKIKTPGMAQVMCLYANPSHAGLAHCLLTDGSSADLFESSRYLRRMLMPFIPHTTLYLDGDRLAVSQTERKWAEETMGTLRGSFPRVWPDSDDDALLALLEVAQHMADFTILVENYVEGRAIPRPPVVLTDQRNYVQHRLMSLEPREELENRRLRPADLQYEVCRLGCIAYSFLVVFPFPPVVGLFERLSKRMQLSILRMRTDVGNMPVERKMLQTWLLTMGAIVSIGLPERTWFLEELSPLLRGMAISSWAELEELLMGFLWHPKTNGRDGLDVYRSLEMSD
jgi:hypothetical protein